MITQLTDLQKLGLDLYRGSVEKYSVTEGENAIRNAIMDACGGTWNVYNFMQNRYKVYAIIAETLSVATGNLAEDAFANFVETRMTNLGDRPEFIVEDNNLFRVSVVGAGENDFRRQKLYGKKLPITTFELGLKIYADFEQFLANRINWTEMVNRVAKSFNNKVALMIYQAIYDSYTSLTAPYQVSGVFSESGLLDLCTHIQSATGQSVSIYGTKKSLSKVVGATDLMSNDMKNDLHNFGHYKNFQGIPMIELPQGHINNTTNFAINDSFLLVVPDGEKIVKLLFEGDAYIFDNMDAGRRNDQQIEYSFARKIGLGILKSDVYGIFRIA